MQSNYLFDWANWLKCVAKRDYLCLTHSLFLVQRLRQRHSWIINALYFKILQSSSTYTELESVFMYNS